MALDKVARNAVGENGRSKSPIMFSFELNIVCHALSITSPLIGEKVAVLALRVSTRPQREVPIAWRALEIHTKVVQ